MYIRILTYIHTYIHAQIMRWKFTAQEILEDEFNAYIEEDNISRPLPGNNPKLNVMAMQVSQLGA